MVPKSLNSSQLDMRLNFMLDSLFAKKYVCLRNYSQRCLNTRIFIKSTGWLMPSLVSRLCVNNHKIWIYWQVKSVKTINHTLCLHFHFSYLAYEFFHGKRIECIICWGNKHKTCFITQRFLYSYKNPPVFYIFLTVSWCKYKLHLGKL